MKTWNNLVNVLEYIFIGLTLLSIGLWVLTLKVPPQAINPSSPNPFLKINPYNKVKGCLSVQKDLINRWTEMVLLYIVTFRRSWEVYNYSVQPPSQEKSTEII